jgi:hypothetical protein
MESSSQSESGDDVTPGCAALWREQTPTRRGKRGLLSIAALLEIFSGRTVTFSAVPLNTIHLHIHRINDPSLEFQIRNPYLGQYETTK